MDTVLVNCNKIFVFFQKDSIDLRLPKLEALMPEKECPLFSICRDVQNNDGERIYVNGLIRYYQLPAIWTPDVDCYVCIFYIQLVLMLDQEFEILYVLLIEFD